MIEAATGSCHLTSIRMRDVEVLEWTFAYLNAEGVWTIPPWLVQLRRVANLKENSHG